MSSDAMKKTWGNPAARQFNHSKIRVVRECGITARVHKELAPLMRALILKSVAEGWALPDEIEAYEPWDAENPSPRAFGIVFNPPTVKLAAYAKEHGWEEVHNGWLAWTKTPEEAIAEADSIDIDRLKTAVVLPPPGEWETRAPGVRELEEGDKGDDVMFIQLALGCPSNSGVYDSETGRYAAAYNHRIRVAGGPRVTAETWSVLTRQRDPSLEHGDTGFQVRAVQAALRAYDWADDIRVSGRFDKATHAAIVELQETQGLRPTGRVRHAEWAVLFHLTV